MSVAVILLSVLCIILSVPAVTVLVVLASGADARIEREYIEYLDRLAADVIAAKFADMLKDA
ncbi:MAG TPA: hypothetical protein PKC99_12580 [Anaerolineales bacterium]|nr:hypothetical protein [Anaerolineales bacterium]